MASSVQRRLYSQTLGVKRHISFGMILGIALLMEIDLEPLHLPDVLEADPQEPGTPRGNVQWYLFSSLRAE